MSIVYHNRAQVTFVKIKTSNREQLLPFARLLTYHGKPTLRKGVFGERLYGNSVNECDSAKTVGARANAY